MRENENKSVQRKKMVDFAENFENDENSNWFKKFS